MHKVNSILTCAASEIEQRIAIVKELIETPPHSFSL
jgi:hypothetical protein